MVRGSLTDRLPEERRPRLMPVDTALGHDAAAAAYESRLRETLGNHPRLDLALLGLGPDGHTASLFPGKPALEETRRLAVGVPEAGMEPQVARVTLTLPLFNTAREVVFLVVRRRQGGGGARAPSARRPTRRRRPRACARAPARCTLVLDRRRRRGAHAVSEDRFIGIDVGGTKVVTAVLENGEYEVFDPVPTRTESSDALVDQLVDADRRARGRRTPGRSRSGCRRSSSSRPAACATASTCRSPTCRCARCSPSAAGCRSTSRTTRRARRSPRPRSGGQIVCENLVMFTIGTGVGGGLVLNGKLYRGATSAAELGHTMIGLDLTNGAPADPGNFPQPGSLETLASGRALDRLTLESARAHPKSFLGRRLAKGDEITGHDAVEGAREGDVHCQHVIRVLGERLGIGIANAINTFDPDEIVIGGGVSLAGDLLLVPAERTARHHTVPGAGGQTKVRLARHGPQAGVLGAAAVADAGVGVGARDATAKRRRRRDDQVRGR